MNTKSFSEKYIVGALVFIYLILRLINLTKIPIFNDEAIYLDWGWKELNTPNNLFLSLFDSKQPLLMWIFGISQKIFLDPLFAGRVVSVFTGLATMLGIYFVGKHVFDYKVAILSAIIYILIPISSFYDRQAMMESSMAAVGVLALYLLMLSLDSTKIRHPVALGAVLGIGLFIKTTSLIFAVMAFISFIFFIVRNPNKRELNIKNLLITISISQLILAPLYAQSMFWKTLSTNDRYTLAFSDLIRFPVQTWINNLIKSIQMIFWHITPLVSITGLVGALLVLKQKRTLQTIVALWLIVGLAFIIFTLREVNTRYLIPALPLFSLFSVYLFHTIYLKEKIIGISLFVVSIMFPAVFSYLLITNPANYFNTLNRFTRFSQKGIYVSHWTSGHGINEVKDYLENEATNKRVVAAVRLDAGNPESAIFAYFNASKQVIPAYLDSKMFGDQLADVDCLEASIPVFFISRDIQMAGLNKYFEEVERFYKPEGENFIGIHKLKTDCVGNTLKLL